ncbi:hypothetical protein M405DRAFT_868664 [Rhizopogon salebrosus TDB-379]|nr:hypothetical protein M405DRAFT_868664 [Rhizopogon salebrosus TDB-379]
MALSPHSPPYPTARRIAVVYRDAAHGFPYRVIRIVTSLATLAITILIIYNTTPCLGPTHNFYTCLAISFASRESRMSLLLHQIYRMRSFRQYLHCRDS